MISRCLVLILVAWGRIEVGIRNAYAVVFCVDNLRMGLEAWCYCESVRIPMAFWDSYSFLYLCCGLIELWIEDGLKFNSSLYHWKMSYRRIVIWYWYRKTMSGWSWHSVWDWKLGVIMSQLGFLWLSGILILCFIYVVGWLNYELKMGLNSTAVCIIGKCHTEELLFGIGTWRQCLDGVNIQ